MEIDHENSANQSGDCMMEIDSLKSVDQSGDCIKPLPPKFKTDFKKICVSDGGKCLSDLTKFDFKEDGACTRTVDSVSDSDTPMKDRKRVISKKKFTTIQNTLHDSIIATERIPGKKSSPHAEKYLSALLSACSEDQRQKLMKYKSDKHHGHVPLSLACKMRNLRVVKFLVEHCKAEVDGNEGNGLPLLWAVANQDENIVKYLLDKGADPGKNAGANFNVLMYAMNIFMYEPFPLFGYGEMASDSDDEDEDDESEDQKKDADDLNTGNQDLATNDETGTSTSENKGECREGDKKEPKEDKGEPMPVPWFPKFKIIKMLIDKGAVEKCSGEQLFEIFTTMTTLCNRDVINIGSPDELYEKVLKLLLKKKLDLANIRNAEGMSLVGYEMVHKDISTKCPISDYMCKYFDEGNGKDINSANVLKNFCVGKQPRQHIEDNVDTILNVCSIDSKKNEVVYNEDKTVQYKFIHPCVYLASAGKNLLEFCLHKSQIPLQAAVDALDGIGAFLATDEYFRYAVSCWQLADQIRTEMAKKTDGVEDRLVSPWEKGVLTKKICDNAKKMSNPHEGVWSFVDEEYEQTASVPIKLVQIKYRQKSRLKRIPKVIVNPPVMSFKFYLDKLDHTKDVRRQNDKDENGATGKTDGATEGSRVDSSAADDNEEEWITDDEEDIDVDEDKTRSALLLKAALVQERLMGFGSLKTFDALARHYREEKKLAEYVTVLVYSFPYFLRFVSQEEQYLNREILKTSTLKNFVMDLAKLFHTILVNDEFDKLTFDQFMAVLKCFFLNMLATPRKQRGFKEMVTLLIGIRAIDKCPKSEEENKRFSDFVHKVISDDLRNCYGQSLLHYASAVVDIKPDDKAEELRNAVIGSPELVEVLLGFGANPNCVDDFGMTPLHTCYRAALRDKQEVKTEQYNSRFAIIDTLVKAGAHTDCLDARSKTPIMYSETSSQPLCPVGSRSLRCLASQVILRHNLPYGKHLPSDLKPFIEMHKKRGNPKAKSKRFLKEFKLIPSCRIIYPRGHPDCESDVELYDD